LYFGNLEGFSYLHTDLFRVLHRVLIVQFTGDFPINQNRNRGSEAGIDCQ
jgi:hypothetical protein